MKRGGLLFVVLLSLCQPCLALDNYRIEVLQVGSAEVYDAAYEGILDGLARQGIVKDNNASISRTVVQVSRDPSLWERVTSYFCIRNTAAIIAQSRPDLVITLGGEATRAFGHRMQQAGVPAIFSGVCPPAAPGNLPGVVIRPQPYDMIRTALLTLPGIDELGIIRTSSPEAAAFTADLTRQADACGITVITAEIAQGDSVAGAARVLLARGVDAFIIPPDGFYEKDGAKAARELIAEAEILRVPCMSALLSTEKGPLITLSPDFGAVGDFTASQAMAILTQGKAPADIPVVSYIDQDFTVDLTASRRLGISFRPKTGTLLSLN
jgi:putative tryptophan/tyrosine transport system substrate-binding protein